MSPKLSANSVARAVREITEAVVASDYVRASSLAEAAAARGLVHPIVQIARALRLESMGCDADALARWQEAARLSPRDARILNALGLCLAKLHRLDEALQTFDEAIAVEPDAALAHQRKGMVFGLAGRVDEAERAYEQAFQLEPRNLETLASLASLSMCKGAKAKARFYAERALAVDPHDASARVALAQIEIGDGAWTSAARRLRRVVADLSITGHARSVALGLLGDALDGAGATKEAFEAYAAANAEREKLHEHRFRGHKSAGEILDEVTAAFADSPAERWTKSEAVGGIAEAPRAAHVFLLGFPRTGTTLLEQALECHAEIVTLDERDFLADIAATFLSNAADVDRLSLLGADELSQHRKTYWQRVAALGLELSGRVFVDKQPFNTIKLPLIAKLFPEAKVLFAIRDPRDVVLSCFRRQLDVDLLRFEFLTLEGAARMYHRFMRLADLCRGKLPLSVLDHRYEDLMADFDAATERVCAYLGVQWSASMRDFAVAARGLEANKASTGQLRRGLYDGVGQWRHYREELGPVLPRLEPWVARFGYPGT